MHRKELDVPNDEKNVGRSKDPTMMAVQTSVCVCVCVFNLYLYLLKLYLIFLPKFIRS